MSEITKSGKIIGTYSCDNCIHTKICNRFEIIHENATYVEELLEIELEGRTFSEAVRELLAEYCNEYKEKES